MSGNKSSGLRTFFAVAVLVLGLFAPMSVFAQSTEPLPGRDQPINDDLMRSIACPAPTNIPTSLAEDFVTCGEEHPNGRLSCRYAVQPSSDPRSGLVTSVTAGPLQRCAITYSEGDQTPRTLPDVGEEGPGGEQLEGSVVNSARAQCSWDNIGVCFSDIPGNILSFFAILFLSLASAILAIVGVVFNWVVLRTVFQFGEYFGTSDGMLVAWGVMRDISNIGLLFGFIFMGVLLILNVDGGGHGHGGGISARKAIPRLIIFAVLINFSLFTSQAVIDVANAFASTFSNLAGTECNTATTGSDLTVAQTDEACANVGISGKIIAAAGITSIFDLGSELTSNTGSGASIPYAITLICLTIFVLVTAIVLLAGAILLCIRVVVLSLLMVTSPIGFAGMVIPGLSGIASKWWHTLMSQAFFAPVFLLLIFISIKLTEGLMGENTSLAAAVTGNAGNTSAGNLQVVMVFFIVTGFMIGSLMAASKMGAMGASFATGFAQKAVTYPFAVTGRSTIGAGSAGAMRAYEAAMGRARNSQNRFVRLTAKSPLGNIADDAVAGTLDKGKNMKFFGGRSFEEERKHREERGDHLDHEAAKAQAKLNLTEATKALATAATDDERATANEAIQASLQKMSDSDIRDILKDSKTDLDSIARNLSPEKFASLMKDKDLSEGKKHDLSHSRFGELEGFVGNISGATSPGDHDVRFKAVKDKVKQWSNDDLTEFAKADPGTFKTLMQLDNSEGESLFTDEQREALEKSKSLTNSQRKMVKDESVVKRIDAHVKSTSPVRIAKAATMMGKIKKAKDRAKLDEATLATRAIIDTLTPADLPEIMNEQKLSAAQKTAIIDRINTSGLSNHEDIKEYLDRKNTNSLVVSYWT